MSITTKLVASTLTIGTIGGAGYTANYFLNPNTLGKALESKKHTLLGFDINNASDHATWNLIVKDYAKSATKLNNLTIDLTGNKEPTKDNIDALKEECSKVINSTKYGEDILLLAERFCVTPVSVKDLLEKQGYKSLDTDESTEKDIDSWNTKVTNYVSTSNQNTISGVDLTSSTPTDQKERRNKLRKACNTLGANKTHAQDFHSNYSKFKEWCAIPKVSK